jgi:hypothetical protein
MTYPEPYPWKVFRSWPQLEHFKPKHWLLRDDLTYDFEQRLERKELIKWLRAHCKGRWKARLHSEAPQSPGTFWAGLATIAFTDKDDALLFKMIWC